MLFLSQARGIKISLNGRTIPDSASLSHYVFEKYVRVRERNLAIHKKRGHGKSLGKCFALTWVVYGMTVYDFYVATRKVVGIVVYGPELVKSLH